MNVWTVMSVDDLEREPLSHCVIGSYTSRGRALDECVDYIIERIEIRADFAWSAAHDENHEEAAKFFSERKKDGRTVVRRGCLGRLREYIRDELGGCGAYYVYDGSSSWHFDVDENAVEGELWHTVTWGDSDTGDPDFTTPWPEAFTNKETAVKTFVDYARDLFKSREGEIGDYDKDGKFVPKKPDYDVVERYIRQKLDEEGRVQVDLLDGCCVSCVLYHDDAKNVKE